ncbi:unnamed protein product [Lymnaea stagnalis]|uniref:Uncharacterized protein n=1 Tax=Lymnaea stagnalis TaxID=6523 RepID=A0AAV2HG39_LYMST
MGCAPKYADRFNFSQIDEFQMALYAKNVIAVGPCGLDCTIKLDMGLQRTVFKLQIEIATEMGLPLVIQSKMADLDCLDLLERYTPSTQKIHIQGFEGDDNTASCWMSSFPNVYFGLTPVIGDSATPTYIKDMVRSIPLNRVLLESGAPHFVPEKFSNDVQSSHFGFALVTAQAVGELRRVSMDTVLKVCRDNTRRFYDI